MALNATVPRRPGSSVDRLRQAISRRREHPGGSVASGVNPERTRTVEGVTEVGLRRPERPGEGRTSAPSPQADPREKGLVDANRSVLSVPPGGVATELT